MSTHLDRYVPACPCTHCTRVADAAHKHYQIQTQEIVEQNKRLIEQVPPPPPPTPIRLPNDWLHNKGGK